MNGRIIDGAIDLATWIEDGVRRLLRQAALGELGSDLSATADETLIATGLEAGDAEITVFAADDFELEDSPGAPGREAEDVSADEFRVVEAPAAEAPAEEEQLALDQGPAADIAEAESYLDDDLDLEEDEPMETRILEPIPAPGEIKVTATHWLDEVDEEEEGAGHGHSLEWPAAEERDLQHRERIDTPRVRHLFPVPDSNWEVSHLEFEYSRHGGHVS